MKESVFCTDHYLNERSPERLFTKNDEEAIALANRAWRNGKTVEDYSGKAKRYLEDIMYRVDPKHTVLRILSDNCYIFSDKNVLITVYPLGKAFRKLNAKKAPRFSGDGIFAATETVLENLICIILCWMRRFFFQTYIFAYKKRKEVSLWHSLVGRSSMRNKSGVTSNAKSRKRVTHKRGLPLLLMLTRVQSAGG